MRRRAETFLSAWKLNPSRKPLLLQGVRQSGKTFILKNLFGPTFPACHYFDMKMDVRAASVFESGDLRPERILSELEFISGRRIDPERDLIVFDEIQACPKALLSLKYFCDFLPGSFVAAAGSLLGLYLSNEPFPVGKVEMFDVGPMDFREFLEAVGQRQAVEILEGSKPSMPLSPVVHDTLWNLFGRYITIGGMPEAVSVYVSASGEGEFTALERVRSIQQQLVEGWLSDIAQHAGNESALHVQQVWQSVPGQLGRDLDDSADRFRFKGVIPGRKSYRDLAGPIAWLEKARMLKRVPIINRVETPLSAWESGSLFKLYIHDTAILQCMAGIPLEVSRVFHPGFYKGWVAENAVAQELVSSGLSNLHCWKGNQSEVEFLADSCCGPVPIEVKSGRKTRSKSLSIFRERFNPPLAVKLGAWNFENEGKTVRLPLYAACLLPGLISDLS